MKILVALQYDNFFPESIVNAMIDLPVSYYWGIRLHPKMKYLIQPYNDILQENGIDNFEVYNSTNKDFYEIYDEFDCLVTPWSSLALEALNLNMITIITPETSDFNIFKLYENSQIMFISNDYNHFLQILIKVNKTIKFQNKKITLNDVKKNTQSKINSNLKDLKYLKGPCSGAFNFANNIDQYKKEGKTQLFKDIFKKIIRITFGKNSQKIFNAIRKLSKILKLKI